MILVVTTALAGWTQPAGSHYVKGGVRGIVGESAFPSTPIFPGQTELEAVPIGEYQDWAVQVYGEVGVTDSLTAVFQGTPVGWSKLEGASTVYTGQLKAGVRYGLLSGTHNLAVEADAGYTPPVGEKDLLAATSSLAQLYRYVPTESGAELGGKLAYGIGWSQNWVRLAAGASWFSTPGIDPAMVGSAQLGRTTKRSNRWDLTVPFRVPLGDSPMSNVTGAGQTHYVGFTASYTLTFGQGFGLNTGLNGVFVAASNLAAPTLPLFLEHSG